VHDLVLDSGARSGRLLPGASARIDVGVVGRSVSGWCSVVGHRQMGMVLTVRSGGALPVAHQPSTTAGPQHVHGHGAPPTGFTPYDAVLPPLGQERVHRRTLTVREAVREVAPGIRQRLWTYDGAAPGPTLHGRVGDLFEITLVNAATMGHSIDFPAGALAPDGPMRTLAPGQSLVYRFRATRAGIWMYHCSTMPMSAHIANGMFGAVVIEPPGLPAVDRSYLLVQSELYLGADGEPVDVTKVQAEQPDAVVFNGYAGQYDARPLRARVGQRVRVWVLDAGPNRSTSFHVVGGQFDTVWAEGAFLLERGTGGSQALALAPAQGGFVELAFPETGRYPFVSHVMIDAERGARGVFQVAAR
jgi:nitrite reductase (NO-forming)